MISLYDFDGNLMSDQMHEDVATESNVNFTGIMKNTYGNSTVYYKNSLLHRIGGPAVEDASGYKPYYIDGNEVSKIHHDILHMILKLKGLL